MAVLPEDSASIPGSHLVAHNCMEPQLQGTPSHRHTSKQNINAHKINNKILKRKINKNLRIVTLTLSPCTEREQMPLNFGTFKVRH